MSFTMNNKVGAADVMKAAMAENKEFKPGTSMTATSTVEISISCRNLANTDVLSKSDPLCVVYHKPIHANGWIQLLKTEVLENNLNPDFTTKLKMDYRFEHYQGLRFEIYDIDSDSTVLEEKDVIGYAEVTVATIVAAGPIGHQQALKSLDKTKAGASLGKIILVAEELAVLKDEIFLRLCAFSVGSCLSVCLMPKSFYTISKVNEANNYLVVYRSKEMRGRSPLYPSVTISGQSLCNGDKDRQLKIEVCQKDLKGEDKLVGSYYTTVNKMAYATDKNRIELQNQNGQQIDTSIAVLACTILPQFTFVDYVQAGTRIHLCFSIDFTSSNGDPNTPKSLHHISKDPTITNPYEQAIEATGLIIQDYDNTGIFPVYGFGARTPPTGTVSHEFPVTLADTPNCRGIAGVIRAYRNCIGRVQLFGPTNFSPVINRIATMASRSRPGQHYYLLVIVTDGTITDFHQTKEAIVKASVFPMSIIIVGVGDADFTSMKDLDGDDGRVSYMGKPAERDIVQFVEYRNADYWVKKASGGLDRLAGKQGGMANLVANAKKEQTNLLAQAQLAEEILAEIPEQLTTYMAARGIEPSMIVIEDSKPEKVFAGSEGPDVARSFNKMKKIMDTRKQERTKAEEERIKIIESKWNLISMVGKGKQKFEQNKPPSRQSMAIQQQNSLPAYLRQFSTDST